jgi:hypothetical protein
VKYFFDTEFYEDGRSIDLISIGVVAEDGREFYAVSLESQLHMVSPWVRKNVLPSLPPYSDRAWMARKDIADGLQLFTGKSVPCTFGDSHGETLPAVPFDPKPEFWAYYADYDWVVLCQLFGTMMALPPHFPKWCRDLKQLSVDVGSPKHPADPKNEHNALADARWNRDLYAYLVECKSGPVQVAT